MQVNNKRVIHKGIRRCLHENVRICEEMIITILWLQNLMKVHAIDGIRIVLFVIHHWGFGTTKTKKTEYCNSNSQRYHFISSPRTVKNNQVFIWGILKFYTEQFERHLSGKSEENRRLFSIVLLTFFSKFNSFHWFITTLLKSSTKMYSWMFNKNCWVYLLLLCWLLYHYIACPL